jgi:ribosomal protein S27AE
MQPEQLTSILTEVELQTWDQLLAAPLPPAPWVNEGLDNFGPTFEPCLIVGPDLIAEIACDGTTWNEAAKDFKAQAVANFIVGARTGWPRALAEIRRLRARDRGCVFCGEGFLTFQELRAHCGTCEPHPLAQANARLREEKALLKETMVVQADLIERLRRELEDLEAATAPPAQSREPDRG